MGDLPCTQLPIREYNQSELLFRAAEIIDMLAGVYDQECDEVVHLANLLNEAVCSLAATPIKHIKFHHQEVLIYWDTWGLCIADDRWVYIGHYSWLVKHGQNVIPFDLREERDSAFLVSRIKDNFSSVALFRCWMKSLLKDWTDLRPTPRAIQMSNDSRLLIKCADALAKRFDDRFAMSSILATNLNHDVDKHEICGLAAVMPRFVDGSRLLMSAAQLPFVCEPHELNAALMYAKLFALLKSADGEVAHINSGMDLLKIFGVSQNTRQRLFKLELEEIAILCVNFPLRLSEVGMFINEVARTMHRMQLSQQRYPRVGRPRFDQLIGSLSKNMARLRAMSTKGSSITGDQFRAIVHSVVSNVSEEDAFDSDQLSPLTGNRTLNELITFLELYLDALFLPPVPEFKRKIDIYEEETLLHDDAAKYYLPEFDLSTEERDELLELNIEQKCLDIGTVADWYLAVKPTLTKQQIKLGWGWLEKQAQDWHRHHRWADEYPAEFCEWQCPIKTNYERWSSTLSHHLTLILVALTDSDALVQESETMDHCVVTYVEQCHAGRSRVFSIRERASGKTVATAEFIKEGSRWMLEQLKGPRNIEMIHHMNVDKDQINILLTAALSWYNNPYAHIPPDIRGRLTRSRE